ncbi:fibronectin type III domain-containing protein [Christiangramia crocea]|uniref:Fibronectin type III domain-containing protein n=1 Tax=Christiangramia crocea TaxID=2904124 RepID=A0A9X2A7N1_9FLAO|nr:fibronectin type III domain-containing protein [Gramella crocea]MCG9970983.1 fibronectin type III domain-containing protein [Gramella crocea]
MSLFYFAKLAASSSAYNSEPIPAPNQVGDAVLTIDGNSLTEGTGTNIVQYYPRKVKDHFAKSFNSLSFASFGVGGQTLDQMIADAATQIDPLVDVSKLNILVFWETVNQMYSSGTGADHFTRTQNYAQGRRDAGYDLIILITPPYLKKDADGVFRGISGVITPNDPGGYHDRLTDFVNLVEGADINTMPWDIHINLMDAPHIGGGRDEVKDNNYFVDSTHKTDAGYTVVQHLVIRKIKELLNIAPTQYAPSNLATSNVLANSLDLSWTAPAYPVSEYRIYKNANLIATSNTTSKNITNLVEGQPYVLTVGAVYANGNEHKSDVLFVRTPGSSLVTPVNLRFDVTTTSVRPYWERPTGVNVDFDLATDPYFTNIVGTSQNFNGSNITIAGKDPDTLYYFRVKSVDGANTDSDYLIGYTRTLAA